MISTSNELWNTLKDCIRKLRERGRDDVAQALDDAMRISSVGTEVYVETYATLKNHKGVIAECCGPSHAEDAMRFIKSAVKDFEWKI